MGRTPFAGALAATLVTCLAAPSAFAWHHGPRVFVGFNFGFPLGVYPLGPYPYGAYAYPFPYAFYGPPYYFPAYYPAPIVVQQQPTVYIERQLAPAAQASAPANYWYYCAGSRSYYPYVRECPAGWQRVAPHPAN